MIIKEGMMVATMMMITMRDIVIMKSAQDSIKNLIFKNFIEECTHQDG